MFVRCVVAALGAVEKRPICPNARISVGWGCPPATILLWADAEKIVVGTTMHTSHGIGQGAAKVI